MSSRDPTVSENLEFDPGVCRGKLFENDNISLKCVGQYMQFCDNVLFLDKGEIVEAGSHEELMNGKGRYAQLINHQLKQSKVRWRPFCPTTRRQCYHNV